MKRAKYFSVIILTIAVLLGATACSAESNGQIAKTTEVTEKAKTEAVELTVSAAASLKESLEEINTSFTQENTDIKVTFNFGSSGQLQQQIEQGAGVDMFLSAAPKQMNALKEKGLLLEDSVINLLGNKLVLIVPADSKATPTFNDLADSDFAKIALGEIKSVPVGQYAQDSTYEA